MRFKSRRNRLDLTALSIALAALAIVLVRPASGHETDVQATAEGNPPKLWDSLGSLHYPITTANPEAQKYFDQGLRLAYAFNHKEARRSFRHAQALDPECALCYWGEALVLGPNLNAGMSADAAAPALAAVARAQSLTSTSDKERALIVALAARYSDAPDADRLVLDAAYADAMVKVAATYPDDIDISVLAAEALMDTQPWDYWMVDETGAKVPKGRQVEMNTLLERTLAANPDHPGALHFYIHLWEASDTPERAEPHAERIETVMPGAGHVVHMASHIYYRVGRYTDSINGNEAAAAADEAFLAEVDDTGIYGGAYYPHNVHFAMVSAQMAGDAEKTIAMADKLGEVVTEDAAATIGWAQPIMLAPYWAHAQYSAPDDILALADPGDKFPFVKAMWHYARGVAYAEKGDVSAATSEAEAIDAIANKADLSFLISNYIPAEPVLQVARHVVLGRIANAKGHTGTAVDEFQRAVAIQDSLPYTEPPFWYYPVRQSLGAALLNAGRAEEALGVFEAANKESPNNGWVLFGLMEAQEKTGDNAAAMAARAAFDEAWFGSPELLDLSRL